MQPSLAQRQAQPRHSSQTVSALAYLGAGWAVVLLLATPRRFTVRHAQIAAVIHLARVGVCGLVVAGWLLAHRQTTPVAEPLSQHLGALLLAGLPWVSAPRGLLLALAFPLGVSWIAAAGGALAAASGHTLDLHALLHADWTEPAPRAWHRDTAPLVDDRVRARELTEQRLHRMWNASRVAAVERRRVERMDQLRAEQDEVLGRLDNLNQMLSLGELSLNRFNLRQADLIAYLDELRAEMGEIERRTGEVPVAESARRAAPLGELPEVRALTVAVVDPSGIPLRTYGHFPLDESIITGMVTAFESLSAEMFGSHVHKTQLADGQVVHFARGRSTVAYAVFEDEPAPGQIARLRDFLDAFESLNATELRRLPVDTAHLRDVPLGFEFATAV